jgi:hypothetical protein
MITLIPTDKLFFSVILCDACGSRLYAGEGLAIWNDKQEVKFICKGKDKCDKYKDCIYSDTIESFFYKLVYNSKMGIIKKSKVKW